MQKESTKWGKCWWATQKCSSSLLPPPFCKCVKQLVIQSNKINRHTILIYLVHTTQTRVYRSHTQINNNLSIDYLPIVMCFRNYQCSFSFFLLFFQSLVCLLLLINTFRRWYDMIDEYKKKICIYTQ